MKKTIYFILFLLFITTEAISQSFIGLRADNYAGVIGVDINPANVVSSKYRMDFNLVAVGAFAASDFYNYNIKDNIFNTVAKESNNIYGNVDIIAPSILIGLGENFGMAIGLKNRILVSVSDISYDLAADDQQPINNLDEALINATAVFHDYNELSFSFGANLLRSNNHRLNVGVTAKAIQLVGDIWAKAENLKISTNQVTTNNIDSLAVRMDGKLSVGYPGVLKSDFNEENLLDHYFNNLSNVDNISFAFDVGFSYRWKPDGYQRDYRLKFDAAIIDIGSVKSYSGINVEYTANNKSTVISTIDSINGMESLKVLFDKTVSTESYDIKLPTKLNIGADLNIASSLYVGAWASIDFNSIGEKISIKNINSYAIVPRWEGKYFGLTMPVGVNYLQNKFWGVGVRLGPIYFGSGNIITGLLNNELKQADAYFGLRIPVYRNKKKVNTEIVEQI